MGSTFKVGKKTIQLSNVATLFAAATVEDNFTNNFAFSGFPEIRVGYDEEQNEVVITYSYKDVQVGPMRKSFEEIHRLLKAYRKTKKVNPEFVKKVQKQLIRPLEIELGKKDLY